MAHHIAFAFTLCRRIHLPYLFAFCLFPSLPRGFLASFGIFGHDFLALRLLWCLTLRLAFVQSIRADVVLPCQAVSLAVVVFVRLVEDVAPLRRLVASLPRLPFTL